MTTARFTPFPSLTWVPPAALPTPPWRFSLLWGEWQLAKLKTMAYLSEMRLPRAQAEALIAAWVKHRHGFSKRTMWPFNIERELDHLSRLVSAQRITPENVQYVTDVLRLGQPLQRDETGMEVFTPPLLPVRVPMVRPVRRPNRRERRQAQHG